MNTLVEAHQVQGDRDKEIEVLTDIIDLDPSNTDAMDQLADCLQERGDWQDLFTLLQRRSVISEEHDKVACHTRIAKLAEERLLDIDLALKEWSKVYEILGPEEETLRRLIHLSKSQFDTASFLHYADELIGLLEGEAKAQLCMEIADAYINELLEENKAVPYLEVALLEDSTFERAVHSLENQYQIMSEWQKLLDLLLHKESKISNVDEQVSVLLKAAEIAEISLQQQEQADEIYLRIQHLDPSNPAALQRVADTLYSSKSWTELLDLYREHNTVFRTGTRATVDMLIRIAEAGEALLDWEVVIESLNEVLEMVPTHLFSLQLMSKALQNLQRIEQSVEVDKRLFEVMSAQGSKDQLADVCLRLGHSHLRLEQWNEALQLFQKSRIYAPSDSRSLKGIIECSWQKGEYSRVAQLCSTLVKNAVSEEDVILGYLWRGFTLDAKLQRQELAEQHYWRVLEYDRNHPETLLYLSSIAMRKGKWKSMLGQLTQVWQEGAPEALQQKFAIGRWIAAKELADADVVSEMETWLSEHDVAVSDDLQAQWSSSFGERLFSI
jgi:tetratricopeptide (TPR) repeat protein